MHLLDSTIARHFVCLIVFIAFPSVCVVSAQAQSCRPTSNGGYLCSDGGYGFPDGMGGYFSSDGTRRRYQGGLYNNPGGVMTSPEYQGPKFGNEFDCRLDGGGGFTCEKPGGADIGY